MTLKNRLTALLAAILALSLAGPGWAEDIYAVDAAHSEIGFRVRHLVSKVSGRFNEFSGKIVGDPAMPAQASVEITIQAASIDTSNDKRDEHLRSADFFDAEKHPTITFNSTRIQPAGQGEYTVSGQFTMHGVTREITVPVTFLGLAKDPWGNEKAGFEIKTTLNRKEYGITWNKALDAGGVLLGDEAEVTINIEASKAKPKTE